jgi:hypothetical protein
MGQNRKLRIRLHAFGQRPSARAPTQLNGEGTVSPTNSGRKLNVHMQKTRIGPLLYAQKSTQNGSKA